MPRLWPVLAILAAALVVVVILFGGDPAEDGSLPEGEDYIGKEEKNPELLAAEAVRRKKAADAEAARRAAARKRATPPPSTKTLFLKGVVVDDATGKPLAGARLDAEHAHEPCPRLPLSLQLAMQSPGSRFRAVPAFPSAVSAADGTFEWRVDTRFVLSKDTREDVFVSAPGYVTSSLCQPARGSEVTIRLEKALKLEARVVDRHGRPVQDARVVVKPGEETEGALGHAGLAVTDKHGRCEVDGLLPGDVMVTGDHPEYMPVTDGPFDPATQKDEVELRLPPALRFTFKIRSDDGSAIKNPTLRWMTDGKLPHEDLLLLQVTSSGPPSEPRAEVTSDAVRIPCDHRNVQLELKADGFEPWRPPAEPLPEEGGTKDVIAVLVRDTSLASLRFRFEDADGEQVGFAEMQAAPGITRLDAKDPGSVVIEGGETLFFPALPAGPYRIALYSPKYAPVEQDVDVVAGEKNEETVLLRPPAKLKVRFTASEPLTVRFRLRRSGRILPAFPVGKSGTQATGLQPLVAKGSAGTVFTGLDAGPVTVDVTDPLLVAEAKTVQLREGETAEVEIEVRKR